MNKMNNKLCLILFGALIVLAVQNPNENPKNPNYLSEEVISERLIRSTYADPKRKRQNAASPNDFLINVGSTNFVAALPTWGPYFAIQFSIKFEELPEDDIQVMQFFSADARFKDSALGKELPLISVKKDDNKYKLAVKIQLTDNDADTKEFFFPNIAIDTEYDILITQKHKGGKVKFSVQVTGHAVQSKDLPKLPIIYNTLGIFICNSKVGNNANATVTNFMVNNIDEERTAQSPITYGISPTWTPKYALSLAASLKNLPDQRGKLSNLIKLVSPPSGSEGDAYLYNQDPYESLGNVESKLPSLNVLKDLDDDNHYWCFMKESTTNLPTKKTDCDLTSEKDGTNKPSTTKKHEISFGQKEVISNGQTPQARIKAKVDGVFLKSPITDYDFVPSDFGQSIKNVKIGLTQNRGGRRTGTQGGLFSSIFNSIAPAIGSVGDIAVDALFP